MRKIEDFKKIYVAGHNGMVGSAVVVSLKEKGVSDNRIVVRSSSELDLRDQQAVHSFFGEEKPDCVIFCAAKVGGVQWNIDEPANFIYDNMMMNTNIVDAAYKNGVKFLLNLGSSCLYPKNAQQPFQEKDILNGPFEPTNEGYAFGKMAGIKMCEMYNRQYGFDCITLMPCNIFGIKDNFDPKHSHVMSGLIRRFHEAKVNKTENITIWGTGNARREFLFSSDAGAAIVSLIERVESGDVVNIGYGSDFSIRDVANTIAKVVEYQGEIKWDKTKPEGMHQKIVCVNKMNSYGWKATTDFKDAVRQTYNYYLEEIL